MNNKDKWVALFEELTGRKPSPSEFLAGKEVDFDFKEIRRIAGLAQAVEETSSALTDQATVAVGESMVAGTTEQISVAGVEPEVAQTQESLVAPVGVQATPIQSEQGQVAQPISGQPAPKVKVPLTKKQKVKRGLLAVGILGLVGLGAGYYYMDSVTGPEVAVEQFSTAVASNDFDRVAQLLSTKDDQWSKNDAKAFFTYLKDEDIDPTTVLERLAEDKGNKIYNDDNGNKLLGLEETGKRLGLFSDYRVATYPIEVIAKTNADGLAINGQKLEKDKEIDLGEFKLASHELVLTGKTDLGDIKSQLVIKPDEVEDNQVVLNLEQKTQRVSAKMPSDLPETSKKKLIVNGKDLGEGLTKDLKVFNNQELEVYATFSYEGADYTTEKTKQAVDADGSGTLEIPLKVSDAVNSKIKAAQTEKETREKEAEEAAKQAEEAARKQQEEEARQAEAWNAQVASVKPEVEAAVNRYRSAINAVFANGSYSQLASVFTSSSNSTYLELINDTIPSQRKDGLRRFEYVPGTTNITIARIDGDYVDATVSFNVISHYSSSSTGPEAVTRYYTLKRMGGQYYFESFNVR